MKYIDVDKLIAEIERLLKVTELHRGEAVVDGSRQTLYWIKDFITSFQQEQPTKGYDEKYLNEKIAKAKKSWDGVDVDKYMDDVRGREQPEIDLEKEIDNYIADNFSEAHDGVLLSDASGTELMITDISLMARHFYELGLNARKKELPEIELNKFTEKIKTFQGRYKPPKSFSIKGAMAFMARMFYQYPNVARLWYEQLPKATMD